MSKCKNKPAVATVEVPAVTEETTLIADNSAEEVAVAAEEKPAVATVEVPAVTSTVISSSATPEVEDTRMVKILVKYPDGYKGRKILKEGIEYSVGAEAAETFINKGIASKI